MKRTALAFALAAALLVPGTSAAFDANKPDEVALAFLPFEPEREEDAAISFLLEDYVQAHLSRKIKHPVHTGSALQPALLDGVEACVVDADCLVLLGGQFNASLVVRSTVFRSGAELQLETEWFATGNGIRVGRERVSFAPGGEDEMIAALVRGFETYFDTSLRVTSANRAGEGGVINDDGSDEERAARLEERNTKRVSSRRSDFDATEDDSNFERSDPTADLRRLVGDDDDADEPPKKTRKVQRRREDAQPVGRGSSRGEDEDEALDDPEPARTTRKRPPARSAASDPGPAEEDDLDLDAFEESGRTVATYADAQRQGYGRREYERYVNSGQTFADYDDRRWANGMRLGIKVGGTYGYGYLMRRYASTIFIRVGGVRTDEYHWERLGANHAGGVSLGVSFAPVDVFGIEVDFAVLATQQSLRREYDSHDSGGNVGEVVPEDQATAHVAIDIIGRAFIFPKRRFKLSPGLGASIFVMSGYEFEENLEGQLEYSERPTAGLIGLSPVVGVRVSATPFLTIFADVMATIWLYQGHTYFQDHQLFGTSEPFLAEEHRQIPFEPIPLHGRLNAGVAIMF